MGTDLGEQSPAKCGESKYQDDGQLEKLEQVCREYRGEDGYPLGIAWQLILYAGFSLSEVLALRWMDLDEKENLVHVQNYVLERRYATENSVHVTAMVMEPLNRPRNRKVPLPDELMDMIADLLGFASPQQVVRKYMRNRAGDKRELVEQVYSKMKRERRKKY